MMRKKASILTDHIGFFVAALLIMVIILGVFPMLKDSQLKTIAIIDLNKPDKLLKDGDDAYYSGDFKLAAENYKALLDNNPSYAARPKVHFLLGAAMSAQKDYKKAAIEFEKILKYEFDDATEAKVKAVADYMDKPDEALHRWDCCDLGVFGHIYVYGACTPLCRAGCDKEACTRIPWGAEESNEGG